MPNNLLISIIDDDDSLRLATSSLLRSMGYLTEFFSSAEEFLAAGDLSRFACIVTDIHMPGMDGIQLTDKLITANGSTKIVLMTARTEAEIHERAKQSGAVCLLHKPFSADSLLECIEKALAHKEHG